MKKITSASQPRFTPRPALSPFLYDLGAAARELPLAAVLPEQFHSPSSGIDTSRGEVALMRAVLEDAIHCFQKQQQHGRRRTQRLAREAEEWLFTDNQLWPFSFLNICHTLGIDADYLRRGLKRWKDTHVRLTPPGTRGASSPMDFPIAA